MPRSQKKPELLIGESFARPEAAVYVYREGPTSGRPDGKYIKMVKGEKIEENDIREEFGPGAYILIQNGPGDFVKKIRVWIHGEISDADKTSVEIHEDDDELKQLRKIVLMKTLTDQLKPKDDTMSILNQALSIAEKFLRPPASDPFETFRDGIDFAETVGHPATPEAILAQTVGELVRPQKPAATNDAAAAGALQKIQETQAKLANLIVGVSKQSREMASTQKQLIERLNVIETTMEKGKTAVDINNFLDQIVAADISDKETIVNTLNRIDNATGGDITKQLKNYDRASLEKHIGASLEARGRADLKTVFMQAYEVFLGIHDKG